MNNHHGYTPEYYERKRLEKYANALCIPIFVIIAIITCCVGFELKHWNTNNVMFHDLREITVNEHDQLFLDRVIAISSFFHCYDNYVEEIYGHVLDVNDVFENESNYVGDFLEFNGTLMHCEDKLSFKNFDLAVCKMIAGRGTEVLVYNVINKNRPKSHPLPSDNTYCLVRGTVVDTIEKDGKKIIRFVGIIYEK